MDHPTDDEALDAYSSLVAGVAESITPRVAALRFRQSRRGGGAESAGSAVVLTGEGHLVTNAHVVGDAREGEASFGDGTVARIDPRGEARVRALHLSYDAPAVDIFVDGSSAVSNLPFLSGTPYVTLNAGAHDFAVSATGTPCVVEAALNPASTCSLPTAPVNPAGAAGSGLTSMSIGPRSKR